MESEPWNMKYCKVNGGSHYQPDYHCYDGERGRASGAVNEASLVSCLFAPEVKPEKGWHAMSKPRLLENQNAAQQTCCRIKVFSGGGGYSSFVFYVVSYNESLVYSYDPKKK